MWAVTHSRRFKAAVDDSLFWRVRICRPQHLPAAISDILYQGGPYTDSDLGRRARLWVGERDLEVSWPQSVEFWHGLQAMHVPATLMIYQGEGHHLVDPSHIDDLQSRTIAWFDKYLSMRQ